MIYSVSSHTTSHKQRTIITMQKPTEEKNQDLMKVFFTKMGVEKKYYTPFLTTKQRNNLWIPLTGYMRRGMFLGKKRDPLKGDDCLYRIIPSSSTNNCLVIVVFSGLYERETKQPIITGYRHRMKYDESGEPYLQEINPNTGKDVGKEYYTLEEAVEGLNRNLIFADYTILSKEEYEDAIL